MEYLLKKNLDNTSDRPIIYTNVANDMVIKCLIDTGADTPVWTSGETLFLKAFPDAELVDNILFELGGFGKENELVPVYRIPKFSIKSDYDNNIIVFNNLLVACYVKNSISTPLILSATMFKHTNYSIINIGEDVPILTINYNKNEYEIGIRFRNNKRLDKIYSFVQQKVCI